MKIQCQSCWKEIEKKGNRVLCIKCSNKRDKEIAKQRRATQESKDYHKEYNHNRWKEKREASL